MALKLEAGTHEIHLAYETPFLKLGALISVVSFAAVIIYVIIKYRRKKR